MLEVAMGQPGSFCDNCAVPTRRGYELRGPLCSVFYCECCADRKFGEAETQRAKNKVQSLKEEPGRLASVISAPGSVDPSLSIGRPIGFMRD
jgi:predicted sulfurtransferase